MTLWDAFSGKLLMTFVLSMLPVLELRGAIPVAVAHGLDFWIALPVAIAGNLLPVPFIILFARKVFALLRRISKKLDAVVTKLEARAHRKSDVVLRYAFWGLVILVAIPLPGTGAWTGALIASLLDMRMKYSLPAILAGICMAGVIMCCASYGMVSFLSFLL